VLGKAIWTIVIVGIIYWACTNPGQADAFVHTVWSGFTTLIRGL
jgi:hypothetical protein